MSHQEFLAWREFYRRWPFDDLHRFHRPAALVATCFGGGDIDKKLDWLQPPSVSDTEKAQQGQYSDADLVTLQAFGFAPKRG